MTDVLDEAGLVPDLVEVIGDATLSREEDILTEGTTSGQSLWGPTNEQDIFNFLLYTIVTAYTVYFVVSKDMVCGKIVGVFTAFHLQRDWETGCWPFGHTATRPKAWPFWTEYVATAGGVMLAMAFWNNSLRATNVFLSAWMTVSMPLALCVAGAHMCVLLELSSAHYACFSSMLAELRSGRVVDTKDEAHMQITASTKTGCSNVLRVGRLGICACLLAGSTCIVLLLDPSFLQPSWRLDSINGGRR